MAGRVDWATFVQKIYEAFDKKVNDMLHASVMAAGDKVAPKAQFNKTGSLDKDTVITLAEDVEMATGEECVIMGTRAALSKLAALGDVNWISEKMKDERHTTGAIGVFEGIRLVTIPQAFETNNTGKRLVDDKKLLFMPVGENKFVKLYNEGESQIREISDGDRNQDMTMEYEYQMKMGVATIIGKKFGTYSFT